MEFKYVSSGWNAWDAKGVSTADNISRNKQERADTTYLLVCGGAYVWFCIARDDGEHDESSIRNIL